METRIRGRMVRRARRLLNTIASYLDTEKIDYHLEGGTLLGLVRDHEFLEWDFDLDLSIPSFEAKRFLRSRYKLWLKGYRVSRRKAHIDYGPIKKGEIRILKVKHIFASLAANFVPSIRKKLLVADVFMKFSDKSDVFWIAKRKIMKVPAAHYDGYEIVEYDGYSYRAPSQCNEYLSLKYGDWKVPVKEWNCGRDEKTIVASVNDLLESEVNSMVS